MDFWKIILSLAARKFVGPPLILLSLAVGAVTFYFVPVHYTSNVLMVLTTSAKGVSTDPNKPTGLTNPLLQFTDGLKTTASILIQSMNAPDIRKSLGAPVGGTTELVVDDGRTNPDLLDLSGPYIYISVDARTAEQAQSVVSKTQTFIRDQLENRQKGLGAPRSTFITVAEVVPVSVPERQIGGKLQAAAAAFVLAFAATFGVAYAVVRSRMPKRPNLPSVVQPSRPEPFIVPNGYPDRGFGDRTYSDRSYGDRSYGDRSYGDMDDAAATVQWRVNPMRKPPPPMISSASVTRVDEERVDDHPTGVFEAPIVDDADEEFTVVVVSDSVSDGDEARVGGRAAQNGSSPDDTHSS